MALVNPTPKRLILSLLSAPSLPQVEIRQLLRWSALFEIDEAALRVAVGRLVRQQLLESPSRGVYRIGPAGAALAAAARSWSQVEERVTDWQGDWLLAHTAHLGRSDRAALRNRERALHLRGFAEYRGGLWCRPANLAADTAAVRQQLLELGLDNDTLLFRGGEFDAPTRRRLYRLWPRKPLEAGYRRQLRQLQRSSARLQRLALPAAARESMLVGEAAIRTLNADPLLPEAMVDVASRRQLVQAMQDYDKQGRAIWQRFSARA